MTDLPDDIAYIARRRQEGAREKEIAAELDLTPSALSSRASRWNVRNPSRRLPPANCRPETPFYVQAAELRKAGHSSREIARRIGKSVSRTEQLLAVARGHGLLPFKRKTARDKGGVHTLTHYREKGAAPPVGQVKTVFALLTPEQVLQVVEDSKPGETLAHALARIVKEHLDAQQAPK